MREVDSGYVLRLCQLPRDLQRSSNLIVKLRFQKVILKFSIAMYYCNSRVQGDQMNKVFNNYCFYNLLKSQNLLRGPYILSPVKHGLSKLRTFVF